MKKLQGKLIAITTQGKTGKVEVARETRHPLYQKIIRKKKIHLVDLAQSSVSIGDYVVIAETRPISKTKHFKVIKKINENK